MNFGERLKYLREREKMFQSELADKLNLAPSTISMYERGDRDPDTSTLAKIAEIFNVTTDYLLGRSEKEKNTDKNLHIAASSDIDLAKLAKLDKDKQKAITDNINNMINMFYNEFGKKG